jgi:hypothetical protein
MPTYRVSKAQSLRMRAFDKKAEAAEARKVKHADKKAKADKKAVVDLHAGQKAARSTGDAE